MRHFYYLRTVNTRADLCLQIATTIESTYMMDLRLEIIPVLSNKAFDTHLPLRFISNAHHLILVIYLYSVIISYLLLFLPSQQEVPFLIKNLNVSVKNEPAVTFSSYEMVLNVCFFILMNY